VALNLNYEDHIGRVRVGFILSAPALAPDDVTALVGLEPSHSALHGGERKNFRGDVLGTEDEGYWRYDSHPSITSKDVNDHIRYLLSLLLPHRDGLRLIARDVVAYFDVLWESSYLYAGTGPVLDQDCVAGIAALSAGIGFDIYQVDSGGGQVQDTRNRDGV